MSHNVSTCVLVRSPSGDSHVELITTSKISTSFHGIPRIFQTGFHRILKKFEQFFTEVNGSPCHSEEWPGQLTNLEIQVFEG